MNIPIFGKPSPLDDAIDQAIFELQSIPVTDEKYATAAENLKRLYEAKKVAKQKPSWTPSPDVIVTGVVTLLAVGIIVGFEDQHVLTSKAFAFIPRLKL